MVRNLLVNGVARPEVRRACESPEIYAMLFTPIAITLSFPPGQLELWDEVRDKNGCKVCATKMINSERSSRIAFLGLIAWVSMCLLVAGWANLDPTQVRALSFAGLFGLIAAVGLSESLQCQARLRFSKLMASSTTDPLTGVEVESFNVIGDPIPDSMMV